LGRPDPDFALDCISLMTEVSNFDAIGLNTPVRKPMSILRKGN